MNIFRLDNDPKIAAQMMCDKHVVKMIVEYGQLLSTAHRILDGVPRKQPSKSGKRMVDHYVIDGAAREELLYKVCHKNHPSAIWARANTSNYRWLYLHFQEAAKEYTRRYNKVHLTYEKLGSMLWMCPFNIVNARETIMPQCMPDDCKKMNVVDAYREYYVKEKSGFAKWTNREVPSWFAKSSD